jgi:hypothetical protein
MLVAAVVGLGVRVGRVVVEVDRVHCLILSHLYYVFIFLCEHIFESLEFSILLQKLLLHVILVNHVGTICPSL